MYSKFIERRKYRDIEIIDVSQLITQLQVVKKARRAKLERELKMFED